MKQVTDRYVQPAAQPQLLLGLDQFIDQSRSGGEAHTPFLTAGCSAQTGQQMRHAGAAVAVDSKSVKCLPCAREAGQRACDSDECLHQ